MILSLSLSLSLSFFQRGVFVAGLREEIVNNAEQVLKLLESGEGFKANLIGLGILRVHSV